MGQIKDENLLRRLDRKLTQEVGVQYAHLELS
jgi:hypothetical protein